MTFSFLPEQIEQITTWREGDGIINLLRSYLLSVRAWGSDTLK